MPPLFRNSKESYAGKPRIDPETGQAIINTRTQQPDTRITFTDQNGVKVDKSLSNKINDPNIKGPFDTDGRYETIYPTVTGKLGLPLPPE